MRIRLNLPRSEQQGCAGAAGLKRDPPALPEPFSLLFIAGFINMHSACPKVPLLYSIYAWNS
jgi:hypothetical protein